MVLGEEFLPQRGQTGLECVFDHVRKAGDGRSLWGDVAGEEVFDHTHGTGCGEAAAGRNDLVADRIEHLTLTLAETRSGLDSRRVRLARRETRHAGRRLP